MTKKTKCMTGQVTSASVATLTVSCTFIVYGFIHVFFLIPTRMYALLTMKSVKWGQVDKFNVKTLSHFIGNVNAV